MGELVPTLRRCGELDVSDELAAALMAMSPATMDRRLAALRAAMTLRGRSHTKPGSLLNNAIAIRTWAQGDDVVPGCVAMDLVGHEAGNAVGEHACKLTVTDIATGWTENRSVPNKGRCGPHLTNYFLAQQKLISKVRDGAKVTKKYDVPRHPPSRRSDTRRSAPRTRRS